MPGAGFGKAAMLSCTVENVRSPVANAEGVASGRATLIPAIAPDAPVRFSMRTVWPKAAPMRSERRRAITSVGPPAAKSTISVIGRDGYLSIFASPLGGFKVARLSVEKLPFVCVVAHGRK